MYALHEYAELSIKELYNTHKDPEDGLLYLMYSNLDPYGCWFHFEN